MVTRDVSALQSLGYAVQLNGALWPDTLNHDKGGLNVTARRSSVRCGPACGVPGPIANKRPFRA